MTEISETLVEEFGTALAARTGMYFPELRRRDLLRGLTLAAPEFGFAGASALEACARWLLAELPTRRQTEILASHFAVGETYFFREPATFAALEQQILPALIADRRATGKRLRIWSVGCSTGEETYSLAILLARLIPDIEHWSITLLGTDINPSFLAAAAKGIYREWSFRGVPAWVRKGYFHDLGGGTYALLPSVKKLARFDYLNLVDDLYPCFENDTAAMDIIMCRHVLMYFNPAAAHAVVQKLCRLLRNGGWLIVSQTEASATLLSGLVSVTFPDCLIYRKADDEQAVEGGTSRWNERDPTALAAPAVAAMRPPEIGTQDVARDATENASPSVPTELPQVACKAIDLTDDASRPAHDECADGEQMLGIASAADSRALQDLARLARACANEGRLDSARQYCEAAVSTDKLNPELRYLLASILMEQGHLEDSVACLKQALYLDPNFVLAHFALGNAYRREGPSDQATRHFAIAARLLRTCAPGSLPFAEGLSAARLLDIIETMGHAP